MWPLLLLLAGVAVELEAAVNCNGTANKWPVLTTPPRLVRSVPNGKLFVLDGVSPPIRVLHLWGTPYAKGVAQGLLLRDSLHEFVSDVFQFGAEYFGDWLVRELKFPKELADEVAVKALEAGLDTTYELTRTFTPKHFFEELRGIADASGVEEKRLVQLNMIPELLKAGCTWLGAWGPAIAQTEPGSTLFQLRALDWATTGAPFNDYPVIQVYHPDAPSEHAFALVGYPAFVGTVTGYSNARLGLSEELSSESHYNGTTSRIGIPFHFLFRDLLQFDPDISAALSRIYAAERTVSCLFYLI